MGNLVIYPTDISQWHALVNEAENHCACQVAEELESYLVFLLMRFSQQSQLATSVLGMDFLSSMNVIGSQRHEILRDVGDKSLLFCGLFPGIASKRRVSVEYFVAMGQAAYYHLANIESEKVGILFASLSDEFVILKNILQAMRSLDNPLQINLSEQYHRIAIKLQ